MTVEGRPSSSTDAAGARWTAALSLKEDFPSMGEQARVSGLRVLLGDRESDIRGMAGDILLEHFDKVPGELALEIVERFTKDVDPNIRTRAARILFTHYADLDGPLPESVELLLGDPNVGVRRAVGKTVNLQFSSVPEELRERVIRDMAGDEDPWVRRSAAESIVAHYDRLGEGTKVLLSALETDPDNWVREGILEVCAKRYGDLDDGLKDIFRRAAAQGPPEIRRRALTSLMENTDMFPGPQAVSLMRLFFGDEDPDIRHEAAGMVPELLPVLKPEGRSEIMEALTSSPDSVLRRTASAGVMFIYSDMDPDIRTTVMVRLLHDSEQAVRYGILEGLEASINELSPGGAISLLDQFIDDSDVWVRNYTVKLLIDNFAFLGEEATPLLVKLTLDGDIRVRRAVAEGLVRHSSELSDVARSAMIERLEHDEDPFVVRSIAELAAADWEGADEAMRSRLLGALLNPDPNVQVGAARAVLDRVAELPRHVVEKCLDLTEPSAPEEVRRGFMDLFGERLPLLPKWFRDDVVETLTADPSPWVRARLMDALNESFSTELLGTIKEVTQKLREDDHPEVMESILYLLQEHLPELEKTGHRTLDMYLDPDGSPRIKVRVAAVIIRHRTSVNVDVLPFLEELALNDDPGVRLEFFEIFAEESKSLIPSERREILNIFLSDEDEDIRAGAKGLEEGYLQ